MQAGLDMLFPLSSFSFLRLAGRRSTRGQLSGVAVPCLQFFFFSPFLDRLSCIFGPPNWPREEFAGPRRSFFLLFSSFFLSDPVCPVNRGVGEESWSGHETPGNALSPLFSPRHPQTCRTEGVPAASTWLSPIPRKLFFPPFFPFLSSHVTTGRTAPTS